MKGTLSRVGLAIVLSFLAACGGEPGSGPSTPPPPPPPPPPAPVATVEVTPPSATIFVGETAAFAASVKDASGNPLTGRTISWSSSNTAVASVSTSGTVTGVAAGGPVTITATSEGVSGTGQVTVVAPVATVEVTPPSAALQVGETVALTAVPKDADGNSLSGRIVTWSSSEPSVASVSTAGVVTAIAGGGPVTITATAEGKSGTAQITVTVPVASVTVAPAAATIIVGQTVPLMATPRDAANNPLTGRSVTWTSSTPGVATVSASGVVTGVAAGGPVSITATSEGKLGTALVTVLAPVATVTISGKFRVKVGDSYQYTATAKLSDGTVVNRPISWSVSDPSAATMTPDGSMTPLRTGVITIEVTIDGVVWVGTATSYDWLAFGSGSTFGVGLPADVLIANKFGSSEYPNLGIGCSGGFFLLFVDTDNFVTQNGLVTYSFDGGTPESDFWLEFDLFSALGHPGPDGATRLFATRVALSRIFGFAFTEFNGPARATLFRVTGLAAQLGQFATCPSPAPIAGAPSDDHADRANRLEAMIERPSPQTAERALRASLKAAVAAAPSLEIEAPRGTQAARRRGELPR